MGRNVKVGKQRKDKFYKLAKETGYRSRASFKLIQLNRKFEFLQQSRILIDLCAAPGGWLQVAQQSMPVSSLILGVDLVPIKPIPNALTFQEDITTDKCRQTLKKQLKTWKADVVLHDGAPNVGKSWLHDAFAQAQLTLSALKLATELLVPGGWFVTKVFRSKDYNALLWVFGKLFKKVHVTKPQASRNESAEIFVVCQSFTAPDRIDPRFLDPGHLFKEVDEKTTNKLSLFQTKNKPKAQGYENGDASVFNRLKASDFIFNDNHLDALSRSTEIVFDLDDILDHRATDSEIKEYCKDLKVLGKAEVRALLKWRKTIRSAIKEQEKNESEKVEKVAEKEDNEDDDDVEAAVKEANELELGKFQALKRKKKKFLKEKRKVQEKMNLKMIIKDDEPIIQEERELFDLTRIKNKKDLNMFDGNEGLELSDEEEVNSDEDYMPRKHRSTYGTYDRHDGDHEAWDHNEVTKEKNSSDSSDSEKDEKENDVEDSDEDIETEEIVLDNENPLLVDLCSKSEKVHSNVKKWFDKEHFDSLSDDENLDLELIAENMQQKKVSAEPKQKKTPATKKPVVKKDVQSDKGIDDEEEEAAEEKPKKAKKRKLKLDPEGLALGTLMIRSKKSRRDIIENAYNRYAFNDEGLPDWFVKDEEKYNRKQLPVTSEMVDEYKAQLREINARPIKKIVEAKSRKKRRALRKMERARKRAEAVTENVDMNEKEKVEQLKTIYKKALAKKDTKVTYVVAKKGSRNARRPPGVKGRYKIVDKRMKKDDRVRKAQVKTQGKGRKVPQKKKQRR